MTMMHAAWIGLVFLVSSPAQDEMDDRTAPVSAHVQFTLPFSKALEQARKEERLLFLKPIYGGVDEEGAADYRRGTW